MVTENTVDCTNAYGQYRRWYSGGQQVQQILQCTVCTERKVDDLAGTEKTVDGTMRMENTAGVSAHKKITGEEQDTH